jgi:hypothetical protein
MEGRRAGQEDHNLRRSTCSSSVQCGKALVVQRPGGKKAPVRPTSNVRRPTSDVPERKPLRGLSLHSLHVNPRRWTTSVFEPGTVDDECFSHPGRWTTCAFQSLDGGRQMFLNLGRWTTSAFPFWTLDGQVPSILDVGRTSALFPPDVGRHALFHPWTFRSPPGPVEQAGVPAPTRTPPSPRQRTCGRLEWSPPGAGCFPDNR